MIISARYIKHRIFYPAKRLALFLNPFSYQEKTPRSGFHLSPWQTVLKHWEDFWQDFSSRKQIFNIFYAVFAPQICNSGWGESQILVILAVNTPIRSVWCISYLWNSTLQCGGIENQGGSRMWRKSWNLALQCTSLVKWCLGGDVKKWGNTSIVQK